MPMLTLVGVINRTSVSIVLIASIIGLLFSLTHSAFAQVDATGERLRQKNSNNRKKVKTRKAGEQKVDNSKRVLIAHGHWGGDGIRLFVAAGSARIEYACAQGEIKESLRMDKNGNFEASGFHTQEMGGPVRVDSPSKLQRALYTGQISGKTMALKIVLPESKILVGTFKLELGKAVRIHRCL